MADTDADVSGGRVSNNQLLIALQGDVRKLEQTLAGLLPQLTQVLDMGKSTDEKLGRLSDQLVVTNRELALLSVRVKQVEERPLAMDHESRGRITQKIEEHDGWVDTFREDMHGFRNKLQNAQQFTRDEVVKIRGYLLLADKHQVDDAFMPDEMEVLHEVITEQRRWRERLKQRQTEDGLIRVNLQSAKPGHVLTAIAVTVAVLGFLMVYVVPHIRFQ